MVDTVGPRQTATVRYSYLVLLGLGIAFLLVLEFLTRTGVERHSKIQRMINDEYREAVAIRQAPGQPTEVLLVGNSLVGHGIDLNLLRKDLAPDCRVHRYWIYNTNSLDWYFGLKRLFAAGSRPKVVLLDLAGMHWQAGGFRGDFAAQYMFRSGDLHEITSRLDLDRTAEANLVFAHISKFYALRSDIRKIVLGVLMPDLPEMYLLFKPTASSPVSEANFAAIAEPRMAEIEELVNSYGAELILVVPPVPRPGSEHHDGLRVAASRAGVRLAMPMSYEDVPRNEFADDVHLTETGATLFTRRLLQDLDLTASKRNRR